MKIPELLKSRNNLRFLKIIFIILIVLPWFSQAFAQATAPGREVLKTNLKKFQKTGKQTVFEMNTIMEDYKLASKQSILTISEVLKITRQELRPFRKKNKSILKEAESSPVPTLKTHSRSRTLVEQIQSRKTPEVRRNATRVRSSPNRRSTPVPPPVNFASLERDRKLFLNLKKKRATETARSKKPPESRENLNIEERRDIWKEQQKQQALEQKVQETQANKLQTEIREGPLNTHQEKLEEFHTTIQNLRNELKNGRKPTRTILLDLGEAYLESQRYLDPLDPEDSLKLARNAEFTETVLGSYEMAIWAYKRALRFNPNDGETFSTLSIIHDEMGDGINALRLAKRARFLFARGRKSMKVAELEKQIESLENKYAPISN